MKQGSSFPWWTLVVGFLAFRWGGRLFEDPSKGPGFLTITIIFVLLILGFLWGMKMWMQGKLAKLQGARYVPIDIVAFASGNASAQNPASEFQSSGAPRVSPDAAPLPEAVTPGGKGALPFNLAGIQAWTEHYSRLGFEWLSDYTLDEEARKVSPGQVVTRLMVHREQRIYGCIRQTIMNGQALPLRPALYTFLEDGGEIFTIASNAQDSNIFLHRPQDIYDFMPGSMAEPLMQKHMERREQAARLMGRRILPHADLGFYMAYEGTGASRLLEAYKKASVFALVRALATMNSVRSLPGDLGQHLKS
jgi:hypothetical protein